MKLQLILYIAVVLVFTTKIVAQQAPQLTHFMFNESVYNPSSVVDGGEMCASVFYRSQWLGVIGAPVFMGVNINLPKLTNNMGVGLTVYNDKLGKLNNTNIDLNYAYSVSFEKSKLSMGIKLSISNKSFSDIDWITPDNEIGNDPSIIKTTNNSWSPDFGIGFKYFSKKWSVGASVLNLIEMKNTFDDVQTSGKRQYYFTGSYNYIVNSTLSLVPNLLLKSDLNAHSLDININSYLYNNIVIGATYRWQDATAILLGYKDLKGINIYYSYDFGMNEIGSFRNSGGSHEVSVNYCFLMPEKVNKSKKNRNVRFL